MEESGKACVVLWMKGHLPSDEPNELRTGHINKQRIFGTYRTLKAIKTVGTVVPKSEVPPENHEKIEMNDTAFIESLSRALQEHAFLPKAKAELGLLDHFKQAGFYVDIDDKLNVVAPAVGYTEEWFKMVADDADEALQMVRSNYYDHKIMAVLYKADTTMRLSGKERHAALDKVSTDIKTHLVHRDKK